MSDGFQRAIEFGNGHFFQDFDGFRNHFHAVANHEEVVASQEGGVQNFVEFVVVEDCAHVEVIGHDQPLEAHFLAEEMFDDGRGKRGGAADIVQSRDVDVRAHHAVDFIEHLAERDKL